MCNLHALVAKKYSLKFTLSCELETRTVSIAAVDKSVEQLKYQFFRSSVCAQVTEIADIILLLVRRRVI